MQAKYWHAKSDSDETIVCDLCPRACQLKPGQHGFCFIRQNINGFLMSTAYGLSSGFCIDPIEKKPLNHFYPGSTIFSFGTIGCNLGCLFCQNWHISKVKENKLLTQKATPVQIANAAKASGCKSVAFTYNEPIISIEYTIDTAQKCHELGLHTVGVTAGYITPKARDEFFNALDAVNIDIKGFTENFYNTYCNVHLQPILENIIYIKKNLKTWVELTTLLIPTLNDSDKEIHALTEWIATELGPDVPIHFTAFTPHYKLSHLPPTPPETLLKAREIALSKGLHFVYVGNVSDTKAQNTYCPTCKKVVIQRSWHRVMENHIIAGQCEYCKTPIAGRFNS